MEGAIRDLCEFRLALYCDWICKKLYTFTHFFKITVFLGIKAKRDVFVPIEKR